MNPPTAPSAGFRLGLIGYPLGHSFSPRMHAAGLRAANLAGEYLLYPIPPLPQGAAELAALIGRLRRGELHGLNVTIPHKESVLPLLDELSPEAQAIGAANTLVCQGDRLIGANTDAPGFLADLRRFLAESVVPGRPGSDEAPVLAGQSSAPIEPTGKTGRGASALVLGAGGSARAVVWALASAGWEVTVAARRLEQSKALCATLSSAFTDSAAESMVTANLDRLQATPLDSDSLAASTPDLIVNTTPVGMYHRNEAPGSYPGASPWPAGLPFPPGARVYDLVYNPPETALLQAARRAGLPAANGLGMLLEQAALAFERWTGCTAPRPAMRQALGNYGFRDCGRIDSHRR